MRNLFSLLTCLTLTSALFLSGCGSKEKTPDGPQQISDAPPPLPPGASGHPTEGPHHGSLIELGKEEYHGELVHDDDAGTVTIYLLDGKVSNQVPIEAAEITVNVSHDGRPEQFQLAAQPDEGDPQGKSSRFVSNDKELAHHLDEEGVDARLVVKIGGKSFNGKIAHSHKGHNH